MHRFRGIWIADRRFHALGPRSDRAQNGALQNAHVLFRTQFDWDGRGRVNLYFSADDYAKAYVNGQFAAQGPAPGYACRTYYVRRDITRYLHAGTNVLAFHVYYQGLVNRVWVSGDLLCGLLFDVTSGQDLLACSCGRVKTAAHTGYAALAVTGYDTQFMERYDSRAPEVGFELPDYDDGGWEYALPRRYVPYRTAPQKIRNLASEEMTPVVCGNGVYDFRQEFVGNPVITARGNAGDRVVILLGEECNDDGTVRHAMRCNCDYREEWILSGGTDTFQAFDYKAFRYLALEAPLTVRFLKVGGMARHYPFRAGARCRYADGALQKVYALCANTLKYGVQEGYLDCPSREKGQYFGDGVWSALAHIALTGETLLYRKFIENAFDSTHIDAGMTAQGPCALVQTIAEFPLYVVFSLKWYRQLTGDENFVASRRSDVVRLLETYRNRYFDEERRLLCVNDRWNVVEWPASARDGYDFRLEEGEPVHGFHNVMCAYWLLAVRVCEELYGVQIIDLPAAERAYREAFYSEEEKLFYDSIGSSHTALASQLFGVLSGTARGGGAEERLLGMIREKRLTRSNLFVTPFLFLWLRQSGNEALLLELIGERDAWLNMIGEGATTTFEAFSKHKKANASLFHTMFAFPLLFLADGTNAITL